MKDLELNLQFQEVEVLHFQIEIYQSNVFQAEKTRVSFYYIIGLSS